MTFPFRQRRFTHAAGTPAARYVWSPVYVDAMIANGTLDERLYTTYDANYNVTALVNTSGTVVERYMYDPYGKQTVLDPNWSADADDTTDYAFHHGFQGGRLDPATGKIDFRHRQYDPETQRWLQQDPAGYVDGANLFQSRQSNPVSRRDAYGLNDDKDAAVNPTTPSNDIPDWMDESPFDSPNEKEYKDRISSNLAEGMAFEDAQDEAADYMMIRTKWYPGVPEFNPNAPPPPVSTRPVNPNSNSVLELMGSMFWGRTMFGNGDPVCPADNTATSADILREYFGEYGPRLRRFGQKAFMTHVLKDSTSLGTWRYLALERARNGNFTPLFVIQTNSFGTSSVGFVYSGIFDISNMLATWATNGSCGNMGYLGSYQGTITAKFHASSNQYILTFDLWNETSPASGKTDWRPTKRQEWHWEEVQPK